MEIRTCPICQGAFEVMYTSDNVKYCSHECRRAGAYKRKAERIRKAQKRTHCVACTTKLNSYNEGPLCMPCERARSKLSANFINEWHNRVTI